jgi:hypothetical protein
MNYQNALVTFMDILGFARMVEEGMSPNDLNKILEKLEQEFREDEWSIPSATKTICISDCVIRAHPLDSYPAIPLHILGSEAYILGILQRRFLAESLPIRGAMTSGDVHISENRLFGPAYQKSYKLERKAVYPRIIVDEELVKNMYDAFMQRELLDSKETFREREGIISKDEDGMFFVDYLKIHNDACDHYFEAVQFLQIHQDLIIKRLREFSGVPDIIAKYWWMRRYHNCHVDGLSKDLLESTGTSSNQLKVIED